MSELEYLYKIQVSRVVDGDTIDAIIDLGFDTHIHKRIRLHGIDTPETRTRDKEEKKRGLAAKKRLQEIIDQQDGTLYLKSVDRGKYGRCVGILFEPDFDFDSVNDILLKEGHAVPYTK